MRDLGFSGQIVVFGAEDWGTGMGRRFRREIKKNKLDFICMWSWICLFDFGHRRGNQRLLSASGKNGAGKSKLKMLKDVQDNARHSEGRSVKRLVEEEMATESTEKRSKIALSGSESGGLIRPNLKRANKTSKTRCQATQKIMRRKFLNAENLIEAGKVEYYNKYMDTLEMMNTDKEILKLSEDPNSSLMKQFKKIPSNNTIEKPCVDLRLSEEKSSSLRYMFLRQKLSSPKKDELDDVSKRHQPSDKIEILKPERTELQASETASRPVIKYNSSTLQCSLSEIRNKLRLAVRKEPSSGDVASMSPCKNQKLRVTDTVFEKDILAMRSLSRNHFYVEKDPRPLSVSNLVNKVETKRDASAKKTASSFYIEARRHLSELLLNENEDEGSSSRQTRKTLGKLLSVPEFSFAPSCSPARGSFVSHFTAEKFSGHSEVQPCLQKSQEIESEYDTDLADLCSSLSKINLGAADVNSGNAPEACNHNLNLVKEILVKDKKLETTVYSLKDESTSQGGMKCIIETMNSIPRLADSSPDVIFESSSLLLSSDGQNICGKKINKVEACSECDEQDTGEEHIASSPLPLVHPFFSSINIDTDDLASPLDKSERPSPISVLEHVFQEDELSPAGTESRLGNAEPRRLRPICIQLDDDLSTTTHGAYIHGCLNDKEAVFRYVEAVLSSTELSWEELFIRSLDADGLFSQTSYNDRRLLFDCVNEVLNEMCQRYLSGCLLISFLKLSIRPIPKPQNAIQEIRERVERHLLPPPHPQSLEQIVIKDLERDAVWMDLRLDAEGVSVEMELTILEELMEDALLSFIEVFQL